MLLMADLHHLPKPEGRRVAAELLDASTSPTPPPNPPPPTPAA